MSATHVQNGLKSNNFLSSPFQDSITLTNVQNGNAVVGFVWMNQTSQTIDSVADGDGTYTLGALISTTTYRIKAFYKHISGATGNKTITYTLSGGGAGVYGIWAVEITGHDSADLFEAQNANEQVGLGTGTDNATSGTVTPAANGAILIGGHFNQANATSTVGTNFTERATLDTAYMDGATQTYTQPTAAAHASTRSVTSGTATWISFVAAFNAAVGGGGYVPSRRGRLMGIGR